MAADQLVTITDNRSATIAQRKLSDALSTSPRAQQVAQLSTITDNRSTTIAQRKLSDGLSTSPRAQQVAQRQGFIITSKAPVQRAADEEEVQMKAKPVQKAADEEEVQMKAKPVQRAADEEEVQMKAKPVQRAADEEEVQMKAAPIQKKENNTGLPDNLKSGVENLSGLSMDDVNVHLNSEQPAQMQAHAFAQGTDIHVAPGQEQHLPHEAWHVVQQKQGRVKPTTQLKGKISINDDKGLEHEADVMGAKAAQIGTLKSNKLVQKKTGSTDGVAQLSEDGSHPLGGIKGALWRLMGLKPSKAEIDKKEAEEEAKAEAEAAAKVEAEAAEKAAAEKAAA